MVVLETLFGIGILGPTVGLHMSFWDVKTISVATTRRDKRVYTSAPGTFLISSRTSINSRKRLSAM